MTDHIYKTIELTGSSSTGIEDAVSKAITKASQSVHNLSWFEITDLRGKINGDSVAHWQVTMKVGFTLDD